MPLLVPEKRANGTPFTAIATSYVTVWGDTTARIDPVADTVSVPRVTLTSSVTVAWFASLQFAHRNVHFRRGISRSFQRCSYGVAYGAEGTFVVDVAENKQSNVAFVVDETGDGPTKIAKKREGTFDVRVRADLETVERTK